LTYNQFTIYILRDDKGFKLLMCAFSKQLFSLLVALCALEIVVSPPLADATTRFAEKEKIRLAVLYFENESITDRERLDAFRKGIADTLITDLGRLERLQVVERERLDAILTELKFQHSGLADPQQATKLGKILGVQFLLMGSYTAIEEMIRIDARIVEVETGLVLKAEEITGRVDDFFQLEEALVLKIASFMNVPAKEDERSLSARSVKHSFAALLEYSRGIDEMDRGRYSEAEKAFQEALKIDPGFEKAALKISELQQKRGKK